MEHGPLEAPPRMLPGSHPDAPLDARQPRPALQLCSRPPLLCSSAAGPFSSAALHPPHPHSPLRRRNVRFLRVLDELCEPKYTPRGTNRLVLATYHLLLLTTYSLPSTFYLLRTYVLQVHGGEQGAVRRQPALLHDARPEEGRLPPSPLTPTPKLDPDPNPNP